VQITGSFWMGLLLAPIFTAFIGILMERVFLRRMLLRLVIWAN
jgi:hypothetical protein